ncbi:MAG: monovalent cation/H+ antiporter complex subunit F [Eubacteriales bacterium]|nr:monovalent cation/H+ antiporter complex subunit F [Eubacteriales bacterium]
MNIVDAYRTMYTVALVILSLLTLLCLLRAILGPRIADRVVSINMICTLTLCMICILGVMLGEGYLADVALIYSLLGFLAVVVLCKVYIGVALEKREQKAEKEAAKDA